MSLSKTRLFYYFGLFLITVFLATLQSTVWFHWLGWSASPLLWLSVAIYLSLYRRFTPAILQIYTVAMIVCFFSSMRLGVLWLVLFVLHLGVVYLRDRLFAPTLRFFIFSCLGATLGFELLMIIGSELLEPNQVSISFFLRLGEVMLTGLFAPISYFLMQKLDYLTGQEEIWRMET